MARRNVLGHGVRLLCRESTLLDREVHRIAGRVHIGQPLHPPVLVNRHESVGLADRHPNQSGAVQERQRDDVVGDRFPESTVGHPAPVGLRERHTDELDPRGGHQAADVLAHPSAEQRQRPILGGEEVQFDSVHVAAGQLAPGHQRELVQRQQPSRQRGGDERHAVPLPVAQTIEHVADRLSGALEPEGYRVGKWGACPRAGGDDQRIEAEILAIRAADASIDPVHLGHGPVNELGAGLGGDLRQ
jgi:hypothetical protein